MKRIIKRYINRLVGSTVKALIEEDESIKRLKSYSGLFANQSSVGIPENSKIYPPFFISQTQIGQFTYIAANSKISLTTIGKFCSIGPNFFCGYGIHPTNGISTSPMFYSTMKQNGATLSSIDKVEERKPVQIGNDVFIGMNVTVLDGVTIGDGAIIGAGAIVSKDIPPYAIAVGSPIQILRYRFPSEKISQLLDIKWWNFDDEKLKDVEKYFFDIDAFIKKYAQS